MIRLLEIERQERRINGRVSVTRVRRGKILQLTSGGFVAMMNELDRPGDTEEFERDYVSYDDRALVRVGALFIEKFGFRTANDGGRSRVSWLEFEALANPQNQRVLEELAKR